MAAARRQPADPADPDAPGEPGDPDAGASPAWPSTAARAPAATAGPSSRVTGSPRWLVRDHVFGPPGGRRFTAEYASRAAPAAVAPAAAAAINRRLACLAPLNFWPSSFSSTR